MRVSRTALQGVDGRHRPQPHGLVGASLQVVQFAQLLQRRQGRARADAVDLLAGPGHDLGMAPQQPDHPRQGVGRRVLAGQQHGQHIAGHLFVVDAAAGFVGGHDHGLEQIGRLLAQRGVGGHALARLGDEALHRQPHLGHAARQRAVLGRGPPAPGRQQLEDAREQHREDAVEVLLDDVLVGLQRVDVLAEGQARHGIHREAHQVGLQLDTAALARGQLPAADKALGHALQEGVVALDVDRVEAGHHHAALALPGFAVGAEHALVEADLLPDLVHAHRAAEAVGPLAQDGGDGFMIGHGQEAPAAELEAEEGPVFVGPALDRLVHGAHADLEQVADQGQAARTGQVVEGSRPGNGLRCRSSRRHAADLRSSGFDMLKRNALSPFRVICPSPGRP